MRSTGMLDKQNTIMRAAPRKFYKARVSKLVELHKVILQVLFWNNHFQVRDSTV